MQTQLTLAANQSLLINSAVNQLNATSVVFDVGGNASSNSVVIPSNGLYDISGSIGFGTSGITSGTFGYGFRLLKNGTNFKQFDGDVIINGAAQSGQGRTVARLQTGDVLVPAFITQQTSGLLTVFAVEFTVIKLSN